MSVPPSQRTSLVTQLRGLQAPHPRLFFSFDFDKDRQAANLVAGQMKNEVLGFAIEDWSLKEAAPQRTWLDKARQKMCHCDLLVVVVGHQTYRAAGVRKEIAVAHMLGLPVVSVIAANSMQPVPEVPGAGPVYVWSHPTFRFFLAVAREHRAAA